jgi:hypothetical protein
MKKLPNPDSEPADSIKFQPYVGDRKLSGRTNTPVCAYHLPLFAADNTLSYRLSNTFLPALRKFFSTR